MSSAPVRSPEIAGHVRIFRPRIRVSGPNRWFGGRHHAFAVFLSVPRFERPIPSFERRCSWIDRAQRGRCGEALNSNRLSSGAPVNVEPVGAREHPLNPIM
jgi:hypothetical protein